MTTDELRNIVAHIVIGFARKDEAESGINSAKPFVLKATWDSSSGEYSIADYDSTALHTAVNGGRVALLKFDNGNMADYTLVHVNSNGVSDTFGCVSDGTLFSANLSSRNGAVVIDTYNVADIVVIRSGAEKGATAYQKPSGGIPKSDLASAVQTSLGKADTALQSFTESDPTVPAWAKASSKPTYTAAEVGALPDSTAIPSKTSDLTNDSGFVTGSKIYYGTCTTAAATDPKVCTVEEFPLDGNGKPLVGTQICVKFSATDTSTTTTPHLNVNGTGDERIWVNTAVLASAKSAYHGYANRYITYMWDGAYWVWRSSGYDANTTYTNVALGHGYATQNNSSAAAAITAALGSYALTANGIVSVHFNYDVPANATLNVNGKGAKAIYHRNAPIAAGVIKAGDTATFVFSTYYHLLSVDRDEAGGDLSNYYTKTEIDTKIGNVETLLASI